MVASNPEEQQEMRYKVRKGYLGKEWEKGGDVQRVGLTLVLVVEMPNAINSDNNTFV